MNACYSISIHPIPLDKWCEQYFSLTFYEYTNSSAVLVLYPSASVKSLNFFFFFSARSFWVTLQDAHTHFLFIFYFLFFKRLVSCAAGSPQIFSLLPVHVHLPEKSSYSTICTSFCSTANSDFEIRQEGI